MSSVHDVREMGDRLQADPVKHANDAVKLLSLIALDKRQVRASSMYPINQPKPHLQRAWFWTLAVRFQCVRFKHICLLNSLSYLSSCHLFGAASITSYLTVCTQPHWVLLTCRPLP